MITKFKSCRGQTVIEFALIMILVFILIFGIIEFSIIMYDKVVLTNASREGARAGVVFRADSTTGAYSPLTEAEIRTVVGNYAQSRLFTFGAPFNANTDVIIQRSGTPPSQGGTTGQLDVTVNFQYRYLVLSRLTGAANTLALQARTIMRME